jgi:beta-mannosidase
VTFDGKETSLTLIAETFMRDIVLQADRLDPAAVVNGQLVNLLPGEEFTFAVRSSKSLEQSKLIVPPVLQCVNSFGCTTSSKDNS